MKALIVGLILATFGAVSVVNAEENTAPPAGNPPATTETAPATGDTGAAKTDTTTTEKTEKMEKKHSKKAKKHGKKSHKKSAGGEGAPANQ